MGLLHSFTPSCPRIKVTAQDPPPSGEGGLSQPEWAGFGRTGAGGGSAGGRPRRCSCPFTVSASEAALTRTSAIRLPPGLGPETGGGGAGLGAAGEGGGDE